MPEGAETIETGGNDMTKGKKLAATILATLALSATVCAAPRSASEQIQIFAETANSGQEGGWFVSPEKDADWNRWFPEA